jgi:hypothetical protein
MVTIRITYLNIKLALLSPHSVCRVFYVTVRTIIKCNPAQIKTSGITYFPGGRNSILIYSVKKLQVENTTVSTASGIYYNVTTTCRYRGRVGTGLSVLWVAY